MGNSISSKLEWVDSSIVISGPNELFLSDLIRYVQLLSDKYKQDSETEFKRPIQYQTVLRASHFEGSSDYIVHSSSHKTTINSVAQTEAGNPVLEIIQLDKDRFDAKIFSFSALNTALHLAGTQKLKEIQNSIQSNREFLSKISGIESSDTSGLYIQAFDTLASLQESADDSRKSSKRRLLHLLLVLNSFDLELLKNTVKSLTSTVFMNMDKTASELKLLQSFSGSAPNSALKAIDWENDLTFANGYRAPPWRQIYGEIAYIIATPVDKDPLCVTVTQNGYFQNKGYYTDETGSQKLSHEKVGETFPSLIHLLRSFSPHFSKTIDNQEIYLKTTATTEKEADKVTKKPSDKNKEESEKDAQGHDISRVTRNRIDNNTAKGPGANAVASSVNKKKNATKSKSNNDQPSLRWKDVDVHQSNSILKESVESNGGKQQKRTEKKKDHKHHVEDDDQWEIDSASSDEEVQEKRQEGTDLPSEYWAIQKLVKYLKIGNQTATIIAICALKDFDLNNEINQLAIREVGGLEVLVNLLDTQDQKCKIGALQILRAITQNYQIRKAVVDMDGMKPLVELLKDSNEEILRCLAAQTIAHCAKNAHNRSMVRKYGGIKKLVRLLKSKSEEVARCGSLALCSCSRSDKNKDAIRQSGAIPLLAKLLSSTNEQLLIPVVGILQECASQDQYRVAIRTSGMIKFLVENLSSANHELQAHCASAIFKCAEDAETRQLVNTYGGLAPLVNLLDHKDNKELLIAATGAVWKASQSLENVATFNQLKTIKKLVGLLDNQPEEVLVNVVGALGACSQSSEGRAAIRENNGITMLVNLLTGTNHALLVNVTGAVGGCAHDADCMAIIDRLDGVRLLWSLLKSPNPSVQASAAWAICPCIENAKDAGEMVRSFVGGLELIVSLLKSDNFEVLASVCAAIAKIAKDEENLAVITDHGVVPLLAKLTTIKHDRLRMHLAEAIARCCRWGNNRVAFGDAGAVAPLVKYLKSPDENVHRATAQALHQLSMDPDNCIAMHENGVVQLLLGMVGSKDEALQEAAAGCIGNIRRLALASEKASL